MESIANQMLADESVLALQCSDLRFAICEVSFSKSRFVVAKKAWDVNSSAYHAIPFLTWFITSISL
jgi:hypothetical protein